MSKTGVHIELEKKKKKVSLLSWWMIAIACSSLSSILFYIFHVYVSNFCLYNSGRPSLAMGC